MSDEGVHEIHLNGKQLVFLFMSATVVSVVIFLLGVMVGRGIPSAQAAASEVAETTQTDPTAVVDEAGSSSPNGDRIPVSAGESLTYAERLAAPTPARDTLKDPTVPRADAVPAPARETALPTSAPRASAESTADKSAGTPPNPRPAPSAATKAFIEPPGNGYVVQVGAYPRGTADQIAKRLQSKGYPVFVTARSQGLFAVRVGRYRNKREADEVAGRLEQQEQFNNPWVTR